MSKMSSGDRAAMIIPFTLAPPAMGLIIAFPQRFFINAIVFGSALITVVALFLGASERLGAKEAIPALGPIAWSAVSAGMLSIFAVAVGDYPIANWRMALLLSSILGTGIWAIIRLEAPKPAPAVTFRKMMLGNGVGMLIMMLYAWPIVITVDQLHETLPVHRFQAEVYSKYPQWSRWGRSYTINVGPWWDKPAGSAQIDATTYKAAEVGQNICPTLYPGLLGIGWYKMAVCPPNLEILTRHIPRDERAEERRSDQIFLPVLIAMALGSASIFAFSLRTKQTRGSLGVIYYRADDGWSYWWRTAGWGLFSLMCAALIALIISKWW